MNSDRHALHTHSAAIRPTRKIGSLIDLIDLAGDGGMDRQGPYLGCPVVRARLEERCGWWTQPDDEAMHACFFHKNAAPASRELAGGDGDGCDPRCIWCKKARFEF